MAAMDADSRFGAILKLPEDDTKIIVPALETLINDEPNHARAHTLLAMVLVAEDKSNAQRATSLARKAVTLRPSRTLPLLGLARVLVVCSEKPDENKELVETLEKIVELEQKGGASLVEALFYLVVKCTPPRAKLDDKSRLWYAQLAEQEKVTPKQHFELGSFFRKRDVELCKKHLQAVHAAHAADGGHADIAAKSTFWLNTIGDESQGRVERCPGEYVLGLYSTFAAKFDKLLVDSLKYQTPVLLRRVVEQERTGFESALDLGCGTGLSGLEFKGLLRPGAPFVGLDLSPQMLQKARERREPCYSLLVESYVETLPKEVTGVGPFDLITACDVLVYLGDLQEVMKRVVENKTEGGLFCFSVELMAEEGAEGGGRAGGYMCCDTGRFTHKRSYVEQMAADSGLRVVRCEDTVIRQNRGKDVHGLLFVLS